MYLITELNHFFFDVFPQQLLEERDALQLKLSASLRQTQELSRELSLSHQLPAPVSPEPSLDQK